MTDGRAVALKAEILAGESTTAACCHFIIKASSAPNTRLSLTAREGYRDEGTPPAAGSQQSALGTAEA